MPEPLARVVLLGGASGSGKSRLSARSKLPILRLDDFYREGDDPELPRLPSGEVDWDHPDSWNRASACEALERFARDGVTTIPEYDISTSSTVGEHTLELGTASLFIAEGVFVAEVIEEARRRGILADAVCVKRSRWVTMGLRLARDLRERRKSPWFLVRRGILLARRDPAIVGELVAAGFRPVSPRGITRMLSREAAPRRLSSS